MLRTEESLKNYYKEYSYNNQGFKTFNQMYNDVGLAEQSSLQSVGYDYNSAIIDAYKTAKQQSDAITSSNLGQGFKNEQLGKIDEELLNAYNSYKQNYVSAIGKIEQTAQQSRNQITSELETQARNASLLQNSAYDYFDYLYKSTEDSENKLFETDPWFSRFTVNDKDEGNRLMTRDELSNLLFDTSKDGSQATLSSTGQDFYDRILNGTFDGEYLNYNSWLENQSIDKKSDYYGLYDWYMGYNPYDTRLDENFNPTNKAFIRTAFGLIPSDHSWQIAERFGGFTEDQLNNYLQNLVNDYQGSLGEIDKLSKGKPQEAISNVQDMFGTLKKVAYEFGLEDDYKKYFDEADKMFAEYKDKVKSSGEMTKEWLEKFATGLIGLGGAYVVGSKASTGVVDAAGAAMKAGGMSTSAIGLFVAAIANSLVSAAEATGGVQEQRTVNKQNVIDVKNAYNNLLAGFINEAQSKRRQAEINFYGYEKNPSKNKTLINEVTPQENRMEQYLANRTMSPESMNSLVNELGGKTKSVYNPQTGGDSYSYFVINGKEYLFSKSGSGSYHQITDESRKQKYITKYFKT